MEYGLNIVVYDKAETGERKVELVPGSEVHEGFELGQLFAHGWKLIYREWSADRLLQVERARWLRTPEGRKALDKALEADARGECACAELLAGPRN